MKTILFLTLLFCHSSAFAVDTLDAQIQSLLAIIGESECVFIRNGKSHDATEGRAHIQRKYTHFKDDIDSIESFISLTATKSMMTGRRYEVICGQESALTSDWLHKQAEQLGYIN